MKRALLAFVCTFALSAPAYAAGLGLTFNFTSTNTDGAGGSIGNAAEAWHSSRLAEAATDYRRAPGSYRHAHGRAHRPPLALRGWVWFLCGDYRRERERCRGALALP